MHKSQFKIILQKTFFFFKSEILNLFRFSENHGRRIRNPTNKKLWPYDGTTDLIIEIFWKYQVILKNHVHKFKFKRPSNPTMTQLGGTSLVMPGKSFRVLSDHIRWTISNSTLKNIKLRSDRQLGHY
jgi:hypothetical protein